MLYGRRCMDVAVYVIVSCTYNGVRMVYIWLRRQQARVCIRRRLTRRLISIHSLTTRVISAVHIQRINKMFNRVINQNQNQSIYWPTFRRFYGQILFFFILIIKVCNVFIVVIRLVCIFSYDIISFCVRNFSWILKTEVKWGIF